MPIPSSRYVDITSGVGGAAAVGARQLVPRLFSTNELIPTGSVLAFTDLESVLSLFGSTSEEYKQSAYIFGFISKVITSPKQVQFARWADADTSAQVFGAEAATLTELQAVTAGVLTVTIGGVDSEITALDFSGAASYADVATAIQAKLQALVGTPVATATVVFDAQRGGFNFDSNTLADGDISITSTTAGLLTLLGWDSTAIFSAGIAEQTVTSVVSDLTEKNNNFGSFAFIPTLTLGEHEEAATWNNGRNIEFMYLVPTLRADAQSYYDTLNPYSGTGVTIYDPANGDYPWLLPAALLASQQFDKPAASANYNFQPDSRLTPTVTTSTEANTLQPLRMNYYGVTQEAGTLLGFYQPGILMGGSTAPTAMGVYANEQWLKATLKAAFLNMFLALQQVPADEEGELLGYSYIDDAIDQAKFNGAIATGKQLSVTQRNFITTVSGDENAYLDVGSKGWWRTVKISEETTGGVTKFFMDYTLIYAKRDSVDKVQGRHILI